MGCKRVAIKTAKYAARRLVPGVLQHAGELLLDLERMAREDPELFTRETKRRIVAAKIKAGMRAAGREIESAVVNLAVENLVIALKINDVDYPAVDPSELGVDDISDPATV